MVSPRIENLDNESNLQSFFTVYSGRRWFALLGLTMLLSIIGWSAHLLLAIWQTIEPRPMNWVLYLIIGISCWLMIHAIVMSCIVIQAQIDIKGFLRHSHAHLQPWHQTSTLRFNNSAEQPAPSLNFQISDAAEAKHPPSTLSRIHESTEWRREQPFRLNHLNTFSTLAELECQDTQGDTLLKCEGPRRSLSPETKSYQNPTKTVDEVDRLFFNSGLSNERKSYFQKTNRQGASESSLSQPGSTPFSEFQPLAGSTDWKPEHKSLETQANFLDSEEMQRYQSSERFGDSPENHKLSRRVIMQNMRLSHPEVCAKRTLSSASVPQRLDPYGSSDAGKDGDFARQFSSFQNLNSTSTSASNQPLEVSRNSSGSQLPHTEVGLPNLESPRRTADSSKPTIKPKPDTSKLTKRSSSRNSTKHFEKECEEMSQTSRNCFDATQQKRSSIQPKSNSIQLPCQSRSCDNLDIPSSQRFSSSRSVQSNLRSRQREPSKERCASSSNEPTKYQQFASHSRTFSEPSKNRQCASNSRTSNENTKTRQTASEKCSHFVKDIRNRQISEESSQTTSKQMKSQRSTLPPSMDVRNGIEAPQNSPNSQNSLSTDGQGSGFYRSSSFQALPTGQWIRSWNSSIDKMANIGDPNVVGVRV